MDRASDLAAMAVILALSVAIAAGGMGGALPVAVLALLAAYAATHPRLLAAIVTRAYRLTGRFPRLFARIRAAALEFAATLPAGQDSEMRFDVALVDGIGRIEIIVNALGP